MCDTTMARKRQETSYLRKIKKPVIEKKRRDRINSCLIQLKSILLENIQHNGGTQVSKLDKADILEMTVSHLRQIQHQQLSVAMATSASVAGQFQEGYSECAKESVRYMDATRVYPSGMSARLERHLVNSTMYSPYVDTYGNSTTRSSYTRSCSNGTDGRTHTISGCRDNTGLHVVIPVKCETATECEISLCSPDSIELGGEASNMNNVTLDSHTDSDSNSTIEVGTPKSSSVLTMPPRIPVSISPPQPPHQAVWRPF